jgi:hypothetical protein
MTDLPPKVEEMLAALRDHIRLTNMPHPDEAFIRWVVGRMLERVQNQLDLPEDMKIRAQVDAILIEDALRELKNAPNRSLLVTAIWAALHLAQTSGPGLPSDYLERLDAQMRSAMGKAAGKKSGAVRKENRPWRSHAEELALEAYARDPSRSNEALAVEIFFSWRLNPDKGETKCPSVATLKRFVAELRRCGKLPPRTGSRRTRTGS